jgi:glutamate carboxypeptidase
VLRCRASPASVRRHAHSHAASCPVTARDAPEERIVRAVDARQAAALDLLAETINLESATENHAGVRRVGDVLARELMPLGFETRWVDVPAEVGRAGHLAAVRRGSRGKRLLLIGHLDTVLQGEPFRRDGNRVYGSGTEDMKGGNLVIVEALRALHASGALEDRQVTVVFTGDEEDPGAPHLLGRQALIEAGEASDVALGFEGGVPGVAVIGRRGIGTWRLEVTAQQAHSSGIFRENRGDGAIFEAARILDRFRLELREPNLTYNPSVIVGGTDVTFDETGHRGTAHGKTNVIPRDVQVMGDLRFLSGAQFEAAREKMTAIVAASLPVTGAAIRFQQEYPAMAPTDGNRAVLAVLDAVSRDLGEGPVVAQDPAERGAGDISFVCTDGRLACLDGLGALGENAHAPGEYLEVDALFGQIRRTALLLYRLSR